MTQLEQRIFSMVDRDRLPHGLLLIGPRQSQKEVVAYSLAQKLVCPEESGFRPCGSCSACRNASEGHHPDVFCLRPEKQEITIEQVRDLQRWIQIGPYEAQRKIALIHEAHSLNLAASNALLKTLEEPPPHAVLVLTTASPDRILRTVHSRLMTIRFPESASEIDSEEPPPDWLPQLQDLLYSPHAASPETIFEFSQSISKERGDLRHFFHEFEVCLRNALVEGHHQQWPHHHMQSLEDLFDRALRAEGQAMRRYGNVALNVDDLLLAYHALPSQRTVS